MKWLQSSLKHSESASRDQIKTKSLEDFLSFRIVSNNILSEIWLNFKISYLAIKCCNFLVTTRRVHIYLVLLLLFNLSKKIPSKIRKLLNVQFYCCTLVQAIFRRVARAFLYNFEMH